MTSTAIYAASISVFASVAIALVVLMVLAAREDKIRAKRVRVRQGK